MLSTARTRCLPSALTSNALPSATLPAFLLPAFPVLYPQAQSTRRQFSSTPSQSSQIGRAPLSIPPSVNFTTIPAAVKKQKKLGTATDSWPTVEIEGPLGKLSMSYPPYMNIRHDEAARKAYVTVLDKEVKEQRAMWGTTRAYLQNHILGVSEGHTAILRLVGVGYRATIETTATTVAPTYPDQLFLSLKVGYSHPIEMPVPLGVKVTVPQPTRILLEGPEKEVLMQFAALVRKWRVPEPYKGKGIFVNGETIKVKSKKIK